jgi:hypothetical protein
MESGSLRGVAFLANARDETESYKPFMPNVIVEPASTTVLNYPAHWAVDNEADITILGLSIPLEGGGTVEKPKGPPAPRYQSMFTQPVQTPFYDPRWRRA